MSDGTTAGMISGRDLASEMDRKRQVHSSLYTASVHMPPSDKHA